MKIRRGFVSNSSSSSFMIKKVNLTELQIHLLMEYDGSEDNHDGWSIDNNKYNISGYTFMDNDYINEFFESIGITDAVGIEWGE